MGLFDGAFSGGGSTADLAARLGLPVVLVIDCAHVAQSVAALAEGFLRFRDDIVFAGVVLNRVASERHEAMLREALAARDIPCLGAIRNEKALSVPDRHLGLVQPEEIAGIDPLIEAAARAVAEGVDLAALMRHAAPLTATEGSRRLPPLGQRIAVARDKAFGFLYRHWLTDWHKAGASLSFFSPLADEAPDPGADAVFLPGGYPELHGAELAAAARFRSGLIAARDRDALIYGECGGYMVLGQALTDAEGKIHAKWPACCRIKAISTGRTARSAIASCAIRDRCPLPAPCRVTNSIIRALPARRHSNCSWPATPPAKGSGRWARWSARFAVLTPMSSIRMRLNHEL